MFNVRIDSGDGTWLEIGDCEWWDIGPCYWLGLGWNFVADCSERTAASGVAGALLPVLLVDYIYDF